VSEVSEEEDEVIYTPWDHGEGDEDRPDRIEIEYGDGAVPREKLQTVGTRFRFDSRTYIVIAIEHDQFSGRHTVVAEEWSEERVEDE